MTTENQMSRLCVTINHEDENGNELILERTVHYSKAYLPDRRMALEVMCGEAIDLLMQDEMRKNPYIHVHTWAPYDEFLEQCYPCGEKRARAVKPRYEKEEKRSPYPVEED